MQSLFDRYRRKKQEKNDACDALINKMDIAIAEMNALFDNKQNFIDPQEADNWSLRNKTLLDEISILNIRVFKSTVQYKNLMEKIILLLEEPTALPQKIRQHNLKVVNSRILKAYDLIGNVEGRKLDSQQMSCIVKEAHNHLVIAGAGTGKTTTVIGKIKYLLKSEKCRPEEILVLSFTNVW